MNVIGEKIEVLLKDEYCLVHVNTMSSGVVLPEHLMKTPSVTLKLSYSFAGVVTVSETGVLAELRFGGVPFACVIPFKAIWAATSDAGINSVWEQNAPIEQLPALLRAGAEQLTQKEPADIDTAIKEPESPTGKARPNFLKRVK